MALISAKTILTSLSLFHITLGFFFLTNPLTVADQALVWILGEATGMPYERSFESQSPALAFLAVILAMMGITDIITLSLPEEISLIYHWGSQGMCLSFHVHSFTPFFFFFFFGSFSLYKRLTNFFSISTHPLPTILRPPSLYLRLQPFLPLIPGRWLCTGQMDDLSLGTLTQPRIPPVWLGR